MAAQTSRPLVSVFPLFNSQADTPTTHRTIHKKQNEITPPRNARNISLCKPNKPLAPPRAVPHHAPHHPRKAERNNTPTQRPQHLTLQTQQATRSTQSSAPPHTAPSTKSRTKQHPHATPATSHSANPTGHPFHPEQCPTTHRTIHKKQNETTPPRNTRNISLCKPNRTGTGHEVFHHVWNAVSIDYPWRAGNGSR
ncbi:hypothetical protein CAURIC_06880 [Corynebacterium auriscanis]|nr:hypothetical protein CAURIC_06880 [Corynebacterium auriscanis]